MSDSTNDLECLVTSSNVDMNSVDNLDTRNWEQISFMVDSGASETVACSNKFIEYDTVETTATGTEYSSAGSGGAVIKNAGEKRKEVITANGVESYMKVPMCDNLNPEKFLASVSRLSQAGHRVVFDDPISGSYIENKSTGVKTWLRQAGGVYFLDLCAFAIFNITNFSQAGYEDVAHRDPVRPQSTQGEVNGTEESEAVKEKTVEELEKDVEEHENKLRDIELEIEAEDAVIPRGFAKTYTPTKEEYDRYCLTHLPYRSWCPICIQAKKKNIAHKKTKSDRGVPVFSIDYMFLNGKGQPRRSSVGHDGE